MLVGALGLLGVAAVLAGLATDLLGKAPIAPERIAAEPGQVAVVDGGTLRLNGVVVRLSGIEAPERGNECRPGLDCGSAASSVLASLIRDRRVECELEPARSGRPVGSCSAGAADLSRLVVARGWARALRADLQEPEQQARAARLGLWTDPR